MAREAHLRVHGRLQIVRLGRRSENSDRHILHPGPGLVVKEPLHARPDMAIDTGHLLV